MDKKFKVEPNYCDCHPETCCCNRWKLVDETGRMVTTFFAEKDAIYIANLLNRRVTNV